MFEVIRLIDDKEMLDYISETADMGRDSLHQVIEKTDDDQFISMLKAQMAEYESIFHEAEDLVEEGQAKEAPSFAKFNSQITSTVKTMTSTDPTSKIAEMVIQGTTMGITQIIKHQHNYTGTNQQIKALSEKLIHTQQANIENMKQFL